MVKRLIAVLLLCALSQGAMSQTEQRLEPAAINAKSEGKILGKQNTTYTFYPGNVVNIIKIEGSLALIESDSSWDTPGGVWIPLGNLSRIQDFVLITKWDGDKSTEVGAGDYDATFTFDHNGNFSKSTFDEKGKKKIIKGKMYRHHNILWLVPNNNKVTASFYQSDIFLIMNSRHLCQTILPNVCESAS